MDKLRESFLEHVTDKFIDYVRENGRKNPGVRDKIYLYLEDWIDSGEAAAETGGDYRFFLQVVALVFVAYHDTPDRFEQAAPKGLGHDPDERPVWLDEDEWRHQAFAAMYRR